MYLRPVHTDLHLPTLYKFIHNNPLGVLTTAIKSTDHPLLQSSHLPWVIDIPDPSSTSPAKLRGHLARANPHAKALISAATDAAGNEIDANKEYTGNKLEDEVMILFTSPVNHYVTPKFYTETKPSTGKVVPTWDYAAVQVYGTVTVYSSTTAPESGAFLKQQINDLTKLCEEGQMGYEAEESWKVSDAPDKYVDIMKKAIVGVEIEVSRIAGKWKMSQELAEGDREGVIKGFEELGTEKGREMAGLVEERGALKNVGKKE
jgi:transcriptional regulator